MKHNDDARQQTNTQEKPGISQKVRSEEMPRKDLFMCPEEGCHKSFQRHGALQNHILYERHDKKRTKMTLLDRAKTGYARRLEDHYCAVASKPTTQFYQKGRDEPIAEVGWALKSKSQAKFNDKQRAFLKSKFEEGETSGNKHRADEVVKEMRRVKDKEGKRVFTVDEFLTEQQISSFFSREAKKKQKLTAADITAHETEAMRREVQQNIIQSLSSHPLVYEDLVLCELSARMVAKLKLDKIKAICNHLGVGSFPGKKKGVVCGEALGENPTMPV